MCEIKPLSDWYMGFVRFTAFYSGDDHDFPLSDWWSTIIDETPDEEVKKPKERQAAIIGRFQGGVLSLGFQPLRIDFVLQPHAIESQVVSGSSVLGSLEEVSDKFIEATKKLINLETFPCLSRIAYGAILILPVENRISGYKQLQQYLSSVKLDAENSREFMYRINRQRPTQVGLQDMCINRLSKWSVAVFHLITGIPPNLQVVDPTYACRIELDINTCNEFKGTLPKDKLNDILDELVGMGKEIAAKGDIA